MIIQSRVSHLYMINCIQSICKNGNYKSIAYNHGQDTRMTVALIAPKYNGQGFQSLTEYYPLELGTVVS